MGWLYKMCAQWVAAKQQADISELSMQVMSQTHKLEQLHAYWLEEIRYLKTIATVQVATYTPAPPDYLYRLQSGNDASMPEYLQRVTYTDVQRISLDIHKIKIRLDELERITQNL